MGSSQPTVVITGAAGFIGSNLSHRFLKDGFNVVGIDNFATGLRSNIENLKTNEHFNFIEADVSSSDEWFDSAKKIVQSPLAYVFHFASPASPPHYQRLSLETIRVNTLGLENCLSFADTFKARVVFASTSEVYGDPAVHPQVEEYWGNVNSFGKRACYDESKRLGEAIIYSWNERYKTKHGLVRIFNTYGPRMNPNDGRVIVNFLLQAMDGQKLTVYGDGKQTRSFCYIDDLISGLLLYARSSLCEPVNLGNGHEFTILELINELKAIFPQKQLQVDFMPLPADDPKQRRPNTSKAEKLLGWKAQIPLREGLLQYAQFTMSQKS